MREYREKREGEREEGGREGEREGWRGREGEREGEREGGLEGKGGRERGRERGRGREGERGGRGDQSRIGCPSTLHLALFLAHFLFLCTRKSLSMELRFTMLRSTNLSAPTKPCSI